MDETIKVRSLPWRVTIESYGAQDFEDTLVLYKFFICILNGLIFITIIIAIIIQNFWLLLALLFITKYKGGYDSSMQRGRFESALWWLTYKLF